MRWRTPMRGGVGNSARSANLRTACSPLSPLTGFDYLFYKDDKVEVNVGRMGEFVALMDKANAPLALRARLEIPKN